MATKKNLKISIITVCYNAIETIEQTILSVIDQNYTRIEYIIIDGESTDGTVDIIRKYSDHIAYWISEPDNGIYDAMNKGIAAATGDYIYFIGADDILLRSSIESLVSKIQNPGSIYYGNVVLEGCDAIYGGKFSKWKIIKQNIPHQALFYPAEIMKKNPYDLSYPAFADWDLNMKLYTQGNKFEYLPIIISVFGNDGKSSSGDFVFEQNRKRIIRDRFGFLGLWYYLIRIKLIQTIKKLLN